MIVDRKFKILAVNPCSGNIYTEENSILFCAKDRALIAALRAYEEECVRIGANEEHINSIRMLTKRVAYFQTTIESKVPDTIGDCELDRCIGGLNL